MERTILTKVFLVLMILTFFLCPSGVLAKYPERAVTLIAPYAAGGDTDMVARTITEAARKDFPKGIAVVNRAGGAGTIGIAEVIRAKPDGYTLGSAPIAPLAIGPHRVEVPYKTASDYQPIIKMVSSMYNIAVRKEKPWKNIQEFMSYAQANPGKIRIGMAGEGTISHLGMIQFVRMAKIDLTIVPFTGGAESITALIGGHIDANCQALSEIVSHTQAGNTRVLVSFEEKRNPLFPEVPTAKEIGFDMTMGVYHSIIAPKGLSSENVSILNDIFKRAMNDPIFRKVMEQKCYVISYEGPDDLRKRLMQDYETYGKLLKQLGLGKK